jgi:7-cyano-7-deazaguanine synthase in queuosine biosynthesis
VAAMKIEIVVHPTATAHEFADVELHVPGRAKPHVLDVGFSEILKRAPGVSSKAFDFFTITAVVYGIDKAVSREDHADDDWTRDLNVTIPVSDAQRWRAVAPALSECVSFVTGDNWRIRFAESRRTLVQKRVRRRRVRFLPLFGDAAALFSGGLDSFVGAIDWLTRNSKGKLLLVGHHDRAVKGPKADQLALLGLLKRRFPMRVDSLQVRVGLKEKGDEISFRSRSLLFLGLACYAAEKLGPGVPIIVPENGAIALNPPLTASRRGACSTRTAHPQFLRQVQAILDAVELDHRIENPYEFATKGELLTRCENASILREGYKLSVSCAKSGHTYHWKNRKAKSCGRCVPCLFRRAALHAVGLDDEVYGYDVVDASMSNDEIASDLNAMLAFVRRRPDANEIARILTANGPVPLEKQRDYVAVIERLIDEIISWLSGKAPRSIRELAGIKAN